MDVIKKYYSWWHPYKKINIKVKKYIIPLTEYLCADLLLCDPPSANNGGGIQDGGTPKDGPVLPSAPARRLYV